MSVLLDEEITLLDSRLKVVYSNIYMHIYGFGCSCVHISKLRQILTEMKACIQMVSSSKIVPRASLFSQICRHF